MSHWLDRFFLKHTEGGLVLRNGVACHHETSQGSYIYPDRFSIVDTFRTVDTMIAKYTVICESQNEQPHKLDTFEMTVISNKENTVFTIYGRIFSDIKLADVEIVQDNNIVYVKLKEHDYGTSNRVKVSLIRDYISTGGMS